MVVLLVAILKRKKEKEKQKKEKQGQVLSTLLIFNHVTGRSK